MASILITGAAGFIGSNLARMLLEEGHTIHAIDNLVTGSARNAAHLKTYARCTYIPADITAHDIQKRLKEVRFDEIYHLACPTGVPNLTARAEEMLHACSYGTFNILEIARAHGAKLLFSSTAEMYGQPERFPQDENYNGNVDPLGARSAYEEGKRFSESCVAMYVRKYGVDARVVRIFNTYGPGMSLDDQRVIPHFFRCIKEGRPLRIYGDGSQTRTHLYIDDLLAGLRVAMRKGVPGEAYNCGGGNPVSVRELAELLLSLTEHDAGMEYREHFIDDHRGRHPAVSKLENLGWQQTISLEEGLRRMIAHYLPSPRVRVKPLDPTALMART